MVVLCTWLMACAPYALMHSPETVAPESFERRVNLNVPFLGGEPNCIGVLAFTSFIHRVGLSSQLDAGLRFGLAEGFSGDLKYQILDKPFIVSTDLAFSIAPGYDDTGMLLGAHPMILFGTQNTYFAVKIMTFYDKKNRVNYNPVGLHIAHAVGKDFRWIPSISVYIDPVGEEGTAVFFSVGFSWII